MKVGSLLLSPCVAACGPLPRFFASKGKKRATFGHPLIRRRSGPGAHVGLTEVFSPFEARRRDRRASRGKIAGRGRKGCHERCGPGERRRIERRDAEQEIRTARRGQRRAEERG